jgi:penicillin-binding protein 2
MCKISIFRDSEVDCIDLGIAPEYQQAVHEGMRQACSSGGTAFSFFDDPVPVLCKTGTAEHAGQVGESNKPVLPHAWIVVATPAENPEMVVVVFLDSAGEGSAEAGPVAKTIIDQWRNRE